MKNKPLPIGDEVSRVCAYAGTVFGSSINEMHSGYSCCYYYFVLVVDVCRCRRRQCLTDFLIFTLYYAFKMGFNMPMKMSAAYAATIYFFGD